MPSDSDSPRVYPGVMISNTPDVKAYRAVLIKALKDQGLIDIATKNDTAKDVDIIESSFQMVRNASAYVAIITHKYGPTPVSPGRNPQHLSITELELNEAVRLKRPILIFIMAADLSDLNDEAVLAAYKAEHLKAFPERLWLFRSLEDFSARAMEAAAALRRFLDDRPIPNNFEITFSPDLTAEQVKGCLKTLAEYYRACGGAGLESDFELAEVLVGEPAGVLV